MLLYALLHLTGYDVSLQDLKDFQQLHKRLPGIRNLASVRVLKRQLGR